MAATIGIARRTPAETNMDIRFNISRKRKGLPGADPGAGPWARVARVANLLKKKSGNP
jgi:hypothetical protein